MKNYVQDKKVYSFTIFFIILILFLGCSSKKLKAPQFNFHNSKPIMVDNKIEDKEWDDGKIILLEDGYNLLYKQDKYYYYLAFRRIDDTPIYIDMFVAINKKIYNIHASQQIGERELTDTSWTDRNPPINWGNSNGWTAGVARVDRAKIRKLMQEKVEVNSAYMQSIIPYDGYEFQIAKKEWDLENAEIRIVIRHMFSSDFNEIVFPKNSEKKIVKNWYKIGCGK